LSTRATEATEVFGDRVSMLAGLLPQFTWSEAELPEGVRIELSGPLTHRGQTDARCPAHAVEAGRDAVVVDGEIKCTVSIHTDV
jgi:hypothetical protein